LAEPQSANATRERKFTVSTVINGDSSQSGAQGGSMAAPSVETIFWSADKVPKNKPN
jgi:hypothetical protein